MNLERVSKVFLLCAGLALASSAFAQSVDSTPAGDITASTSPTPLALINGWYNAPFGTSKAEVEVINGIVHFKGAIGTSGSSQMPFYLPPGFRPSNYVYIAVDLCNAHNGRLEIHPDGEVYVEAETALSNAQCFTSLDGASFALNGSGFTALTPLNGWAPTGSGLSKPEAKNINGIVYLRGAIHTAGTQNEPFVLPKEFRPETYVYAAVDLCNATFGQLDIAPSGEVFVEAENNTWGNAQCFTSLDGVSFAAKESGFKPLTLLNGWTSEYSPAVSSSHGVVSFQGAIYTSGSSSEPFVLPASLRPTTAVYVPVALCDAAYGIAKGRLYIQPSGSVTVQAENSFSKAQCLTSLDGASFVK